MTALGRLLHGAGDAAQDVNVLLRGPGAVEELLQAGHELFGRSRVEKAHGDERLLQMGQHGRHLLCISLIGQAGGGPHGKGACKRAYKRRTMTPGQDMFVRWLGVSFGGTPIYRLVSDNRLGYPMASGNTVELSNCHEGSAKRLAPDGTYTAVRLIQTEAGRDSYVLIRALRAASEPR